MTNETNIQSPEFTGDMLAAVLQATAEVTFSMKELGVEAGFEYAASTKFLGELDELRAVKNEVASKMAELSAEELAELPADVLHALRSARTPADLAAALPAFDMAVQAITAVSHSENKRGIKDVMSLDAKQRKAMHDSLYANDAEYRARTDEISAESDALLDASDARRSASDKIAAEHGIVTEHDEEVARLREEIDALDGDSSPDARAKRAEYYAALARQSEARALDAERRGLPAVADHFRKDGDQNRSDLQDALGHYDRQVDAFLEAKARELARDASLTPEERAEQIDLLREHYAQQRQKYAGDNDIRAVQRAITTFEKDIQDNIARASAGDHVTHREQVVLTAVVTEPVTERTIPLMVAGGFDIAEISLSDDPFAPASTPAGAQIVSLSTGAVRT